MKMDRRLGERAGFKPAPTSMDSRGCERGGRGGHPRGTPHGAAGMTEVGAGSNDGFPAPSSRGQALRGEWDGSPHSRGHGGRNDGSTPALPWVPAFARTRRGGGYSWGEGSRGGGVTATGECHTGRGWFQTSPYQYELGWDHSRRSWLTMVLGGQCC